MRKPYDQLDNLSNINDKLLRESFKGSKPCPPVETIFNMSLHQTMRHKFVCYPKVSNNENIHITLTDILMQASSITNTQFLVIEGNR